MKYSVLAGRDNFKEVILEEKYNFVNIICEELEIDISEILSSENPDVFHLRRLKEHLGTFGVLISFNGDDSLEFYFKNESPKGSKYDLIAKWYKPYYILIKDPSELDPAKKTYFKIFFSFESIFDEGDSDG